MNSKVSESICSNVLDIDSMSYLSQWFVLPILIFDVLDFGNLNTMFVLRFFCHSYGTVLFLFSE